MGWVRGVANAVTSGKVNKNVAVSIRTSTGYTIDPATRRQVPIYSVTTGFGSLQALDGDELKQLDGISQQGVLRALYLYGDIAGVIRPDGRGGDMITIANREWLVVKVLEHWESPTWVKLAIAYQGVSE